MENNNVQNLLGVSMEKIKEMADANTVIGNPVTTPDGTVLIPVSKVSYGFASGGSDLPSKTGSGLFGGGSGAASTLRRWRFWLSPMAMYGCCRSAPSRTPPISW